MRHRFFHLFALPLLCAAVLLAVVQAWQTPLDDPQDRAHPPYSAGFQQAVLEAPATAAALCDAGPWSLADVLSEEPEWPQSAWSAVRVHVPRGSLLAAATPACPFRGPDALLRPPTALPRI